MIYTALGYAAGAYIYLCGMFYFGGVVMLYNPSEKKLALRCLLSIIWPLCLLVSLLIACWMLGAKAGHKMEAQRQSEKTAKALDEMLNKERTSNATHII